MRFIRTAFKLRMELNSQKERMIWQFYDLNQVPVGVPAGKLHPAPGENIQIVVVKFIAVTMPLQNSIRAIRPVRQAALFKLAGVIAKAHSTSQML